jgi:hypothetical protein
VREVQEQIQDYAFVGEMKKMKKAYKLIDDICAKNKVMYNILYTNADRMTLNVTVFIFPG